ncbi:hypothetical protein QCA50_014637 [Cerrena zonata]|uniref:T6SS Phospholipase effector Tle1-like catalytic domain-containing protein n=1 Tax=Cerrena zonata TaxID=2478898 RepID=A0AAW0FQR5_9APHY
MRSFCWSVDTVSAIGSGRRRKIFPNTTTGLPRVCFFRQALALDEQRVKYIPEYAYGATTERLPPQTATTHEADAKPADTKEVWFVGSHSDIGGGSESNVEMASNGPPLRWMSYEAIRAGIRMEIPGDRWTSEPCNGVHDSLSLLWKVAGWLMAVPKSHRTHQNLGNSFSHYDGRRIMRGQKIHASVFAYLKQHEDTSETPSSPSFRYQPKAQIHSSFAELHSESASDPPSEPLSELTWVKLYEMQRDAGEKQLHWLESDILDWLTYTLDKIEQSVQLDGPLPEERYRELERNSKKDEGRFALLNNNKDSPMIIFKLFMNPKISDLPCLSSLMTTLLNFATDRKELSYSYNELYPTERMDLFTKVGSLGSDLAIDNKPSKSAGHPSIFSRFFHRFSSGVGHEYCIRQIGPNLVLSAGEIQGISRDAIFNVYSDPDHPQESIVGTALVTNTRALTSVMSLTLSLSTSIPPNGYYTSCLPTSPGSNWAMRVAFSSESDGKFRLEVLKSLDDLRKQSSKRLPIVVVADDEEPDFILHPVSCCGYSFAATDWKRYPETESIEPQHLKQEYLADIVYGGALYYWYFHLPRAIYEEWSQAIELTWFQNPLASEGSTNYFKPPGYIGPITADSQTEYGCKIKNLTKEDFYVHVLIFSLGPHGIHLFSYREDLNKRPIPPQSSIILGNRVVDSEVHPNETETDPIPVEWRGDGMGTFSIPSGQEKDVSYLVILLSKSYTDYTVSRLPSPFTRVFDFQKAWEEKPTVQPWQTIFIPIIQEKAKPNGGGVQSI